MNILKSRLYYSLFFPSIILIIIWTVKITEEILGTSFSHFGLYPLRIQNITGIVFYVFIHGDFEHLFSNTFAFFILCGSLFYFYKHNAFKIFFFLWIFSGITLWLIGRPSYHIGISGIIYGLASYLFFSGLFVKERTLSVVSLLVVFLYGSIVWGMLPGKDGISWEGHISGFAWGLILSFYFSSENIEMTQKKFADFSEEEFNEFSISDPKYKKIKYFLKDKE